MGQYLRQWIAGFLTKTKPCSEKLIQVDVCASERLCIRQLENNIESFRKGTEFSLEREGI